MEAYEQSMVEARVQFANRMSRLIQKINTENLGFFLLYYGSFSVILHRFMKSVLKKSARNCKKLGFIELADGLYSQANLESVQAKIMRQDVKAWLNWWSQKQGIQLKTKTYLRHARIPSISIYCNLHQSLIREARPFCELAIGYEVQRVQMIHSFSLIKWILFKFGLSGLRKLRFVQRAMRFNQERPLNKNQLAQFLLDNPAQLSVLVEQSSRALSIYADFIEECFQLADNAAQPYQLEAIVES